jgi:hypothetical protein
MGIIRPAPKSARRARRSTERPADLLVEAKRRIALEPGSVTTYPRGKSGGPDQSYEAPVGNYLKHVYGEHRVWRHAGSETFGGDLRQGRHARSEARSGGAASETIQHTLYGGLIMHLCAVLGAMTYVAKRNVHHEDDDASTDKPEKE